MAKFNIQYADKPVNVQSTAAYARPQTGQYEAIAQAGQTIFQIGKTLQQQEDALDFSKGQRQIEEMANAAKDNLTGDKDTDTEVWNKLQDDINNVQGGNHRVNNALAVYRNRVMPNIQSSLDKQHKALLQQNLTDEFDAEGQTLLAKGDLISYQDLLDRRLASKNISKARYEELSKSALSDSLLQQARDLMASDSAADRNRAVGILNNLPDAVELSTEQKEYRRKMLKLADKINEEHADQAIAAVVVQKDKLKNASVLEKQQAAEQMKVYLVNSGVAGNKLNQWYGILDEWSGGDKDPTELYDPQWYAVLQEACDLRPNEISEGQIYSFVGNGKDQGITTEQAKSLVELRKRNLTETQMGRIQRELHTRYQRILKGMYDNDVFESGLEGANQYAELANKLTVFANTTPDATTRDYEEYFADLTAGTQKTQYLKLALRWTGQTATAFSPIRMYGYVKTMYDIKGDIEQTLYKQKAVRERIQRESQARLQQRAEGQEKVINGKRWRLVQRGKTADEDIWEVVE